MTKIDGKNYLTTPETARRIGVTDSRVRHMIRDGRLPSRIINRAHLIAESDLYLVANRQPGQPRKYTRENSVVTVLCDGAALNNPRGIGAWGFVVYVTSPRKTRIVYRSHGHLPAPCTNNTAEYMAVVRALEWLAQRPAKSITIASDSQLIIYQITGVYDTNAPHLDTLRCRCLTIADHLTVTPAFVWHRREENAEADIEAAAGLADALGITVEEVMMLQDAEREKFARIKANKKARHFHGKRGLVTNSIAILPPKAPKTGKPRRK